MDFSKTDDLVTVGLSLPKNISESLLSPIPYPNQIEIEISEEMNFHLSASRYYKLEESATLFLRRW